MAKRSPKFCAIFFCPRRDRSYAWPTRSDRCWAWPRFLHGNTHRDFSGIGLEMACGFRLCGLPSICAMSRNYYAVIGDAKRATFFFGRINRHQIAGEIELLSRTEMRARIGETPVPIYTADDLPQFGRAQRAFPARGTTLFPRAARRKSCRIHRLSRFISAHPTLLPRRTHDATSKSLLGGD